MSNHIELTAESDRLENALAALSASYSIKVGWAANVAAGRAAKIEGATAETIRAAAAAAVAPIAARLGDAEMAYGVAAAAVIRSNLLAGRDADAGLRGAPIGAALAEVLAGITGEGDCANLRAAAARAVEWAQAHQLGAARLRGLSP
jgi:hypothetical protein